MPVDGLEQEYDGIGAGAFVNPYPGTVSTESDRLKTLIWLTAINGYSITLFALLATLFLLPGSFSWIGLLGGIAVSLSGLVEILGHRKLKVGNLDGLRLAAMSQMLVFGSILVYSVSQYWLVSPDRVAGMLSPGFRQLLIDLYQIEDYLLDELVAIALKMTYITLIFASLLYQGGLFIYYRRQFGKLSTRGNE